MLRKNHLHQKFILTLGLIVAPALFTACSSPSAVEPAPAGESGEPAAESAPAESESAEMDEYQTQRENCTWDSPCWPQVVDTIPSAFSEAPMLAEMVAAGDLPSVEERLPLDPLVIEPAEMIGQYGGTWQRAFTGPGDRQNIERMNNDFTLFWDASATELRPRLAVNWQSNGDATEWTIQLRDGLRWSDGEPFTADDYLFWYEMILQNELLVPSPPWWMRWGGELAQMEKIDDITFKITFADPFPAWPTTLASVTVAGHFQNGRVGLGFYAPQHYLEQFHADLIGEEEANAKAEEAGFENWHLYFLARNDAHMNMDLPVMTQWKPTTPIASNEYVLERNPYFWAVDTAGNQLPYFDKVSLELVEELEVLNLRAISGNYTVQGRHISFAKLPVIRENEDAGDYFVDFYSSRTRHQVKVAFSQDWDGDEELAGFLQNRDFRKALSLGIERSEINETFFLGVGTEASFCPSNTPPFFNSDRWDEEFAGFEPDEATALLDSIGLDQKDGDGFRLLPSGDRLVLRIDAVSGAFLPYPEIAERIGQMWEDLGIQLQVNPVERSLWRERQAANEPMMSMFATGDWNPEVAPRLLPTARWAPLAAAWAETPNPDPAGYDGPEWIKEMVLKHWEAAQELDPEKRRQLYIEGTEIMCDNHARLGILVNAPDLTVIVKNNMRNAPRPLERNVYAQTPSHAYPETWFEIQE